MSANDGRTETRLEGRIAARMAELRDAQLLRTLRSPGGFDLSSNDYLGLATHPLLKERLIEAVRSDGVGSTGSRLLRGQRDSFTAVERAFAFLKRTDASLYFSSGYLANIAVLTTFPEPGDVILSDERNHASLIDGVRLSRATRVVFPHADAGRLAELLAEHRPSAALAAGAQAPPIAGGGQVFVVTESLFSMDGDIAPLGEYARLCREAGAALIVDEAHAVGVYGESGSGLIEEAGVADDVFVSINTAGKALGVSGAFVAGRSSAVEYLIQRARPFIFSTAPPPSQAAALEASLAIIASEPERRERLMELSRDLRARLAAEQVPVSPGSSQIIPVILGENDRATAVAASLQASGFDVRAIRPPTVAPGTARLRIAVNIGLTDEIMQRFVAVLADAVRRQTGCSAVSS
jgi:8-amino-7-oxononanoate synthase